MCGEEIQASCKFEDCSYQSHYGVPYTRTFINYCYKRGCPICKHAREKRYTKRIEDTLSCFENKWFITFTFKGTYPICDKTFNHINQCFRAMTQNLRRNYNLTAYIKVIELKVRPKNEYFFHIHTVMDCDQVPDKHLENSWLAITKDSYIIKNLEVKSSFTDYLTKYLVKGYEGLVGFKRRLISIWKKKNYYQKPKLKKDITLSSPVCPYCLSHLYFPPVDEYLEPEKVRDSNLSEFIPVAVTH
jgi:hypothetical protein